MKQGFIKISRAIEDNPIWICSTPEQKTILITLLLMANFRQSKWFFAGKKVTLNPGQFVTGLDAIAQRAGQGVSTKNVRTALKKFEEMGFLGNQSAKSGRLITIANWGLYQEFKNPPDNKPADSGQTDGNIQEGKESKKSKEERDLWSAKKFEEFWKAYPNKKAKPNARKAWLKIKQDEATLKSIFEGLDRAKKSVDWINNGGKYIPHPATWLNGERWHDEHQTPSTAQYQGGRTAPSYVGIGEPEGGL